ncbi:ATP-binding protein [Streptomyces sp. NPDC054775]
MTFDIPEAGFWIAAAAALVLLLLLLHQRRSTASISKAYNRLDSGIRARDAEMERLVTVRLPTLLTAKMAAPETAHNPVAPELEGSEFNEHVARLTSLLVRSRDNAQYEAAQSAKAALKSSMQVLQGLSNEQQIVITQMQNAFDDPEVLHGLLEIDHMNAQFGRRAQAIAALCGSWPGRQRASAPLIDVVRGATSRIRDYRRIQVPAQVDLAVASRAVEPVVLSVAELLDNAARHSQPNTLVQVSIRPAHSGVSLVIDDAGIGLHQSDVDRAARLLSGEQAIDVSRLGDPPQFGFAVIGVLAARYGFTVSVDTQSPYGGVRAVVFLPNALLESADDGRQQPQISQQANVLATPPVHDGASIPEGGTGSAAIDTLPRRRRREPIATSSIESAATVHTPPLHRSANDAASRAGAFSRGTRAARDSALNSEGVREG